MSFLSPVFLWLGFLLILPLILYLLPLPRRKVATAALYLWERFLNTEPFGRASERMRRAIGFALIVAILIALILAAAEMTVGKAAATRGNVIVIIDASASMNAIAAENNKPRQTNLDRAQAAAQELIVSLGGSCRVAVIESADQMNALWPMGEPGREAARSISKIEPFDGASHLRQSLQRAFELWGNDADAEVYVFSDRALPPNSWGPRAHLWLAPVAGDNLAIIDLDAQRNAREISVRFNLANFGKMQRTLSGVLLCNGQMRGKFDHVVLDGGQTAQRMLRIDEPAAANIEVRIDGANDALASDDVARATIPSQEELSAAVVWPDATEPGKPEAKRKNEYVSAVLNALQQDGTLGASAEEAADHAPVTIYVNQMPDVWPAGGAILLYPLRSGAASIRGLYSQDLTVTRQAVDALLNDVDLRGLNVKDAVDAPVPAWAHALVWAQDTPLIWAGQTGNTKVLFVGIPVMPSGSRLPLVASFPVLLRNALHWMLPSPEVLRPGEPLADWTSRQAGFFKNPTDSKMHAFSVLSAQTSDLRRPDSLTGETFARRRSMAMPLVILAIVLLALEWGLFHRRLTE